MPEAYLVSLKTAADASSLAETALRRDMAERVERAAGERVRAYRRHHLVAAMVETARPLGDAAAAVEAQTRRVLGEAGWGRENPAYGEIASRLAEVARLIHNDLHLEAGGDPPVLAALEAFESWYRQRFGTEFPALTPEPANSFQPLVDF